jgi:hypothetical protein
MLVALSHPAINFPPRYRLICLRRKRKSPLIAATHWHDGQISKNLSSPARKNIPLNAAPKSIP